MPIRYQVIIGLIFAAKIKAYTVQEKANLVIKIVGEKFVSGPEDKEETNGLKEVQNDEYFSSLETNIDYNHVDVDITEENLVQGIAI